HPSPGLALKGPGYYEISGIAYSGNGRVSKVEVSADGGRSWAQAALQAPVLSKAFTRFRMPWSWDGGPVVLQSRATDEAGNVQPSREAFIAERGPPRGTPNVAAFKGSGGPSGPLVGGGPLNSTDRDPVKLIGNYWPYATTIFDYTRRAMPWQQPKTLTNDEVYALTAYILALNKIIGENDAMNAETLPKVKMPNRDGFISKYPEKH